MQRVRILAIATMMALTLTAAIGAASASASAFNSEGNGVELKGALATEHIFSANLGNIGCSSSNFTATMPEFIEPTVETSSFEDYSCKFFGSLALHTKGCQLSFHPGRETSPGTFGGYFDIGPTGCAMEMDMFSGCPWIKIPSQTKLKATFKNTGSGTTRAVTVSPNVSNLKYYTEGCKGSLVENGEYHGSWQVQAYKSGKQAGLWIASTLEEECEVPGESVGFHILENNGWFDGECYPVTLSGQQTAQHTMTTVAGNIKCSNTQFSSGLTEPSASLSVVPIYKECTAFGLPGAIKANSCSWVLHVISPGPPATDTIGVSCAKEGDKIEITSNKLVGGVRCTLSVAPQEGSGKVSVSNVGTGHEQGVEASFKASSLKYTVTGGSGFCGSEGTHEDLNYYTGSSTFYGHY